MTNKEAIDILKSHISIYDCCKADHEANEAIRLAIKALEERPQGEWINRETGGTMYPLWERYECNQCHKFNYCYNFCPNCGAEMKGGAE